MGEYAAKVSQILRRCYRDGTDPIALSDAQFTAYIEEIRCESASYNPAQRRKSDTTVIATGRVWLDFLSFVGRIYGEDRFVSPDGTIRAREETLRAITSNGRKIARSYLTHHSFGSKHRERRRSPVTSEQIELLKCALRRLDAPTSVKVRRGCLIDLLIDTGARRDEIASLKVDAVLAALAMEHPLLEFETLKREEGAVRFVPIFVTTLRKLRQYMEVERRRIMRHVYKGKRDHGFFFVSSTTGMPLTGPVLSNEIRELRKLAGIKAQVTPHTFRHAFITNLFVRFIQRHKLTNDDEFCRALLDSTTFKAEVISWTGHLNPDSVDRYIHLAFRELSDYTETVNSVHLVMAMDKYFAEENELLAMLEEGMPVDAYKKELIALRQMAQKDFDIAKQRESVLLRQ
ncbi:tyrosine-type recombinase/integrase [Stutzerimonas chloritidismutans]|uniref:tyrosine-type recombinase/integrase n=1 Tax=Stutzerimonas chloritidismutans TaxID=203192 RepID=UPI003F5CEB8E